MYRKREIIDGKMQCPQCGELLELFRYTKRSNGKPKDVCKNCAAKNHKEYIKIHPQKRKSYPISEERRNKIKERNRIYERVGNISTDKHVEQKKERKEWYQKKRLDEKFMETKRNDYKKYVDRNKEAIKKRNAENRRRIRLEFISAYGGKCECCGENRFEFLSIEHNNGGGRKERKKISTERLLHTLKKEGWKRDGKYSLLCFNCNQAKGAYGYCPHERE